MDISVSFFASQKDVVGAETVNVTIPDGSLLRDLFAVLAGMFPALASRLPFTRAAVNEVYCPLSQTLWPGDSVALIPPVSGG